MFINARAVITSFLFSMSLNSFAASDASPAEREIPKNFVINETGNILVASTALSSDHVSKEVATLLGKMRVFLANLTKALSTTGKTLKHIDAIEHIMNRSGMFIEVHDEEINVEKKSAGLELKTEIIKEVIGTVAGGTASVGGVTKILQGVLTSIGGTDQTAFFGANSSSSQKNIGHMVMVCEDLLGTPFVTTQLYYTNFNEAFKDNKSPCHHWQESSTKLHFNKKTFMFVDPDDIIKYEDNLLMPEDAETELVNRMVSWIKESEQGNNTPEANIN